MDILEKEHYYSELPEKSNPASQPHEEKKDKPEVTTRRLRDRDLLKRKKEEAQEKDTFLEQTRTKRQRKGKGTGRGRRKHQEIEPEPDYQSESAPEAEPDHKPKDIQEKTEYGYGHQHHEVPGLLETAEGKSVSYEEEAGHTTHVISIPFLPAEDIETQIEHIPLPAVIPLTGSLGFPINSEHEEHQQFPSLL